MKNRDQLHRFIKKLSKSEKRAFKLYMSKYDTAKEKKLISLFDAINKMNEFDESALYKVIPQKKITYDLYRLRKRLLNALSDLNFKKDGNSLGEIINRIELGVKYEIPEIIETELAKGYKLATDSQNHYIYVLIAKYEHKLSYLLKDLDRVIEVNKEILFNADQIQEDVNYALMKKEVHRWYINNIQKESPEPLVFSRFKLQEIFNGAIEDKANIDQSKAFYTAKSLYSEMFQDFDTQLEIQKYVYNLSQSDQALCYSFSNLILAHLRTNRLDGAEKRLAVFKNKYLRSNELASLNILEITYYINSVYILFFKGEHTKIIDLLPFFTKYLNSKENTLFNYFSEDKLREFRLLLIGAYFNLTKYDKCLDWIALDNSSFRIQNSVSLHIDLHMKFIEALCYYNLKYDTLVNSLLSKIYYVINKKDNKNKEVDYYYEILQAIIKNKTIPKDWNEKNTSYLSVFGISGLLENYLTREAYYEK